MITLALAGVKMKEATPSGFSAPWASLQALGPAGTWSEVLSAYQQMTLLAPCVLDRTGGGRSLLAAGAEDELVGGGYPP